MSDLCALVWHRVCVFHDVSSLSGCWNRNAIYFIEFFNKISVQKCSEHVAEAAICCGMKPGGRLDPYSANQSLKHLQIKENIPSNLIYVSPALLTPIKMISTFYARISGPMHGQWVQHSWGQFLCSTTIWQESNSWIQAKHGIQPTRLQLTLTLPQAYHQSVSDAFSSQIQRVKFKEHKIWSLKNSGSNFKSKNYACGTQKQVPLLPVVGSPAAPCGDMMLL